MIKYIKSIKLQKKLLHIEIINDRQIRTLLYRRFFNYNKVIYLLKTTRYHQKWMDEIQILYKYINKSIISHLNFKNTIQYQLPLTQKRGGLGLRSPQNYYTATKISALSGNIDKVKNYLRFDVIELEELNGSDQIESEIIYNNRTINIAMDKRYQILNDCIDKFNNYIGPNLK